MPRAAPVTSATFAVLPFMGTGSNTQHAANASAAIGAAAPHAANRRAQPLRTRSA
jgi:hypothetical protein